MGRSTASCFNIISCGCIVDRDEIDASSQSQNKGPDKPGWSLRKKSARRQVPSNTIVTEKVPSSENKEIPEPITTGYEPQISSNVSEKTSDNIWTEEIQTSPAKNAAVSTLASKFACEDDNVICEPVPDESVSAILVIQAAVRRFLAERRLVKHKNVVKLQAAVRGHLVRNHAVGTLRCVQAIVKMQALVRARREKGVQNAGSNSTPTHISIEKLLSNRLARQLLESTPKTKQINIKCDPLKSDSAWNWLERWMSVSSPETLESHTPDQDQDRDVNNTEKEVKMVVSSNDAREATVRFEEKETLVNIEESSNVETHEEEPIPESVVIPVSESKLTPKNPVSESKSIPEKPVSEAKLILENPVSETKSIPEYPVSKAKPIPENPVSETKLKPESPVSETKPFPEDPVSESSPITENPVLESKPIPENPVLETKLIPENQVSETKSILENPVSETKQILENPVSETKQILENPVSETKRVPENPVSETKPKAIPESETEPKPKPKPIPKNPGLRKASNPTFIAAQSRFEELTSSKTDPLKSPTSSNQDDKLGSGSGSGSPADNAYSDPLKRDNEVVSCADIGSSVPTKATLETAVEPVDYLVSGGSRVVQNGASECGTELSITSTLDSPDQFEIEEKKSEEAKILNEAVGDMNTNIDNNIDNVMPEKQVDQNPDDSNIELEAEPSHHEPGSPRSHITILESQGTPSSQVSTTPKKTKSDKKVSSHGQNRKSWSTSKKSSPVRSSVDSGLSSSLEHLPKDPKPVKRRTSSGSPKPDHIGHEPSIPSYMQATESARAKAVANSSPRSSPDVHDKETYLKKRHSLPVAVNGRQGSPRVQRSMSQALQTTKGNGNQERKWQR